MKPNRIEYGTRFYIDLELEGLVARIEDRETGERLVLATTDDRRTLAGAAGWCRDRIEADRCLFPGETWADLTVREVQLRHEKLLGDLRAATWEAGHAERLLELEDRFAEPTVEALEAMRELFRAARSRRRSVHVVEQRLDKGRR